jgi:hypothetical protein
MYFEPDIFVSPWWSTTCTYRFMLMLHYISIAFCPSGKLHVLAAAAAAAPPPDPQVGGVVLLFHRVRVPVESGRSVGWGGWTRGLGSGMMMEMLALLLLLLL